MKNTHFLKITLLALLVTLLSAWGGFAAPAADTDSFIYLPLVTRDYDPLVAFVPAGEFQMGCDPAHNGGYGCQNWELPLHPVYLDAYYIDRNEVTNAQYAQCVAAGGCTAPSDFSSWTRPSYYDNPDFASYPVIYVDWNQATAYCAWTGRRLPTEAEWEKAARGTTVQAYPWGDASPTCALANFGLCVGDTRAVGSHPDGASPYGMQDMAGNVFEWVQDWYAAGYYSVSPSSNPPGPASGDYKVLRGGSWNGNDYPLRTAFRDFDFVSYNSVGFRCASTTIPGNNPPSAPGNPTPADGASEMPLSLTLSWSASDPDGDSLTYDVYLEANDTTPDVLVSANQVGTTFNAAGLSVGRQYYWRIVARDKHGATKTSPAWQFTTGVFVPADMVSVPAGEFQMGCDPAHNGGNGCQNWELPLHPVYLDAYYIDRNEVTNAQYAQCVGAGSCTAPSNYSSYTRTSYYDNPDFASYPVLYVDWNQATAYCAWAGRRLPTEAEWEKAARGTTVQAYPWGDDSPTCALANFVGCVGDTSAVGSYPDGASPYGVQDMAGNVFEWVQDWYAADYYSVSPYSNPPGPASGTFKVNRGSSFLNSSGDMRSAYRTYGGLGNSLFIFSFRCASTTIPGNNPPSAPGNPTPADGASEQPLRLTLSWSASDPDGDSLTYDVYLEANDTTPDVLVSANQVGTTYTPAVLSEGSQYYWRIVARDEHGASKTSPAWQFTTGVFVPADMVSVPAGEFQMGCDQAHNGGYVCLPSEQPLHTVYLDAYYIDRNEVTNAQYAQCVGAGSCTAPSNLTSTTSPSYYGNPAYASYPVIYVDWNQATAYCAWAGRRLPTEAEWEKAARGTTVQAYPWGDDGPSCVLVNGQGCMDDTTGVGSYPGGTSPYGALDMAGNVWEWVQDWYDAGYYSVSPSSNPPGPANDTGSKVVRGGAFRNYVDGDLRSAYRNGYGPSFSFFDIGFRCAQSP